MSELAVLDPRAAFVDVGSEKMHVSIGGGPPRVFGTVTSQLQALRDYLIEHQVRSVAMEATGVYWLALYSVVEAAGLDVRMGSMGARRAIFRVARATCRTASGARPCTLMACCGRGSFRRRIFVACRTMCVCAGSTLRRRPGIAGTSSS